MGFKKTSDTIAIRLGLDESEAQTYTQEEVDVAPEVWKTEHFVGVAAGLQAADPKLGAGQETDTRGRESETAATAMQ